MVTVSPVISTPLHSTSECLAFTLEPPPDLRIISVSSSPVSNCAKTASFSSWDAWVLSREENGAVNRNKADTAKAQSKMVRNRFLIKEKSPVHKVCKGISDQIHQRIGKPVVVVVESSDGGGGKLNFFGAVSHGDSHTGGFDHGQVVLGVACCHGKTGMDVKKSAQGPERRAFSGGGREEFQVNGAGVNYGNIFFFRPGQQREAEIFQLFGILKLNGNTFAGAFPAAGKSLGHIGAEKDGCADGMFIIMKLFILTAGQDMGIRIGVDMNACFPGFLHNVKGLGGGEGYFVQCFPGRAVVNLPAIIAHQVHTGQVKAQRVFHIGDTVNVTAGAKYKLMPRIGPVPEHGAGIIADLLAGVEQRTVQVGKKDFYRFKKPRMSVHPAFPFLDPGQNFLGDKKLPVAGGQIQAGFGDSVKVGAPADAQLIFGGKGAHLPLVRRGMAAVKRLYALQSHFFEKGNQLLQFLWSEVVEQRMGQDGKASCLQNNFHCPHGGDLFPGNKTGTSVPDVFVEGFLDGFHIAPALHESGVMGPGDDTVREFFY